MVSLCIVQQFSEEEAVWESDAEEAFSAHTPQTESLEVWKRTFGQASFILEYGAVD